MQKSTLQVSMSLLVPILISLSFTAHAEKYIVKYKQRATFHSMNNQFQKQKDFFEQFGLAPVKSGINFLSTNAQVSKAFLHLEMAVIEGDLSDQELEDIRNNPDVAFIEQETFVEAPRIIKLENAHAAEPREAAPLPWGVLAVKAPEAWALNGEGEGTRVMILDTGIDKDHPAIQANFEKGHDFVSEGLVTPYEYYDHTGHGTHVAGVILGSETSTGIVGVAPKAKLLMGRVCGLFYQCPTTAILEGVEWAITERVEVLNVSLGSPFQSPGAKEAYARAAQAGVSVVSASGNYGLRKLAYPAAYPSVISVGAVSEESTHPEFSNWDENLDIVAPGVGILSSVPSGKGNSSEVYVDLGQGMEKVKSTGFDGSAISISKVIGPVVFAGLGRVEDFVGLDVTGKTVLIRRGEIAFGDKAKNAVAAGAAAVAIINTEAGLISDSTLNGEVKIPVVMIEQELGEELVLKLEQGLSFQMSVGNIPSSYMALDGTSMAAPHVAGVVLLIRAANPSLTPEQIHDILLETAKTIPDDDNRFGKGMVNAEAAVKRALELGVAAPSLASAPQ